MNKDQMGLASYYYNYDDSVKNFEKCSTKDFRAHYYIVIFNISLKSLSLLLHIAKYKSKKEFIAVHKHFHDYNMEQNFF